MQQTFHPIIVNDLINKWNANASLFNGLPELKFIPPLAEKIKTKGCTCGLGGEIAQATSLLNQVAENLSDEQVNRMKALFQTNKLCFGIQTAGNFSVKCY